MVLCLCNVEGETGGGRGNGVGGTAGPWRGAMASKRGCVSVRGRGGGMPPACESAAWRGGWQQASLAYRTPPSFALPWSSPGSPSTPSAPSESRGRLAWGARRQRRRRLCCSRRIYYCSGGASSLVGSASAACAFSFRPPLSPRAGGGSCTTRAGSHAVDVDRKVDRKVESTSPESAYLE